MQSFTGRGGIEWHYDPDDVLGRGGFGTVYGGSGPEGGPVAVKRLDLTHPRAQPLEMLLREVDISERIQQGREDHLLPIIDSALMQGALLLVMRRAERSLADVIGSEMSEAESLQIIRDVATGIEELHGIPVLHRDLKPANVLLHEGVWKLADFGIARDLDAKTATLTFAGFGTPQYMAPELFKPPFAASTKSDLYALGCIGYEVLTGSPPFQESDPVAFVRLQETGAIAPLPSTVNVALRRQIMRLLERTPSGRPQDARAVVEALGRVIVGQVSPEARRLRELAANHVDEQSAKSAATSAVEALARAEVVQHEQALADLREIVEIGADLVNEGLPDVELVERGSSVCLEGNEAAVRIELWDSDGNRFETSTARTRRENHLLYGQVDGENTRLTFPEVLANLVCEVADDGRLEWTLYRYRRTAFGGATYQYGPDYRRHGFRRQDFFDDVVFPYAFGDWTGLHIFQKEWETFTPESVRALFVSALALPDDA